MIFTTDDPRDAPPALTGMDLVRLALERSATASEGVATITALIERYGQGGSGHDHEDIPYWSSFLVADPTTAWVLETSGRTWEAEEVTATRAISNRTTIPTFDALHRSARAGTEPFVDPRWEACTAAVADGPVTEPGLRRHLRRHVGGEGGWTVCMHVDGVEATTASLVTALPADGAPLARFLLGWPCRSVYVPLLVGQPFRTPRPERFAALLDADRAALDDLEAELDAAVAAGVGPGWNDEAWRRVTAALDALPSRPAGA
jgi:secernin